MLAKTTIALAIALTLGTASSAFAGYEFDSSGAPINMHLVPPPGYLGDIYASTVMPNSRELIPPVRPFSEEEKALFDRQTFPTDSY